MNSDNFNESLDTVLDFDLNFDALEEEEVQLTLPKWKTLPKRLQKASLQKLRSEEKRVEAQVQEYNQWKQFVEIKKTNKFTLSVGEKEHWSDLTKHVGEKRERLRLVREQISYVKFGTRSMVDAVGVKEEESEDEVEVLGVIPHRDATSIPAYYDQKRVTVAGHSVQLEQPVKKMKLDAPPPQPQQTNDEFDQGLQDFIDNHPELCAEAAFVAYITERAGDIDSLPPIFDDSVSVSGDSKLSLVVSGDYVIDSKLSPVDSYYMSARKKYFVI
jgi:hypothetical protein